MTTLENIKNIAAQKKALVKKFHEDLDKMYADKRAALKELRNQEAALLLQLKAEKLAAKEETPAAETAEEPVAETKKTSKKTSKKAA